ncbi:MAG: hypothetical protein E5W82_00820 [Mesorhizobium sp.]|nr:MAG: hypothetical protein E5W82_00820 [Mesorhizobium sp.]
MIGRPLQVRALAGATIGVIAALAFVPPLCSQTKGDSTSSADAFDTIARVMASPRCQNCHTLTDFPRQGEDRHRHMFHVKRGPADDGAAGLPCSTCHGRSNNAASGVPGANDEWQLAPLTMGWDGLSQHELCEHLKDPQHNGNRNGGQVIDHLRSALVRWAWSPGVDRTGKTRTTPPVPYEEFTKDAESWMRSGAACPK